MPLLQMLATVQEEESLGHLQDLTSPVLGKLKEALIFTRLANAQRRAFGSKTVVMQGQSAVDERQVCVSSGCLRSTCCNVVARLEELSASSWVVRRSSPTCHGIQGTPCADRHTGVVVGAACRKSVP